VRSLVRLKRIHGRTGKRGDGAVHAGAQHRSERSLHRGPLRPALALHRFACRTTIGLSGEESRDLRRGGIVHDIGKVAVPEFILLKPGPLDAAERKIMEEHTIVGERICAPLKILPQRPAHHPVAPRKAGRHGLPRPFERRRDSAHRAHPANRGHLRFAHHRSPVPRGALARKGA
jgi:hypothetical protein